MSNIITESTVLEILRQVNDPEIGLNIVDLGLVYSIEIRGETVKVVMTLTSRGCPMHESICSGVASALLNTPGITDAEVELVFDPPWNPTMITSVGRAAMGTF